MSRMKKALDAWGCPEFSELLVQSLQQLSPESLPLQAGLSAGSYALCDPLQFMLISTLGHAGTIEAKVGVFYTSRMPGCACAGDPTVEDEQNEYCILQVVIDRTTAEATVSLSGD